MRFMDRVMGGFFDQISYNTRLKMATLQSIRHCYKYGAISVKGIIKHGSYVRTGARYVLLSKISVFMVLVPGTFLWPKQVYM